MTRPHSLLKFKKAQFVLSRVLTELTKNESSDPNYQLDLEFDREINALLERYGYDSQQAIALIKRHEALEDSLRMSPDGALAQMYFEILRNKKSKTEQKPKGLVT
jgi:hypothetical protein